MDLEDRLADVFDRGLRDGVDSLSATDRELYLIQDFLVEYEMGGLTTYFYNRLPDTDVIFATVRVMSARRLTALAEILSEAAELFRGYVDPDPPTTWNEVLRRYDPTDRLEELHDRIAALDNYGLGTARIA
jgi:hypothetical protein